MSLFLIRTPESQASCENKASCPWGLCTAVLGPELLLLLFSCQVTSDSLRPHRLQLAIPPCPQSTLSLPKFMSMELVVII